jgi:hypothetical protein
MTAMYRKQIILHADSDPLAILSQLEEGCRAAGLSPRETETIISQVRPPLEVLIQSGSVVASSGGQFRADRTVKTGPAVITLVARYGVPPGLLSRLWKVLSRGK